jgi:uncharacterized phage protein (TIGR02218 family)
VRSASAGLISFLEGNDTAIVADLLTITLQGGTVYRWTSYSEDITTDGHTWTAGGTGTAPLVGRGKVRDTIGLDPSDLDISLLCGDSAELGGQRLAAAAVAGAFDWATVTLHRAYMSSPGVVVGTLVRFAGQVSEVTPAGSAVRLSVRSDLEALNQVLPRNVYRELCIHAVFDAGCGLAVASYTTTGTVQAGSTAALVKLNVLTSSGYYNGGRFVFTSGALDGVERTIATYINSGGVGNFTFTTPLPSAPATSDGASVIPGCDKTMAICSSRFSNLNRRRGFDFMPTSEVVQV